MPYFRCIITNICNVPLVLKSISWFSARYVFRAKQQPNPVPSWYLCGLICHPHKVFWRLVIAPTSRHTWRSCRNAQTWSWVRFRYIGRSWIWHLPYITFAKPSSIYFTKLAELPLWRRLFFTNDFSKEWNNWYLISFHF